MSCLRKRISLPRSHDRGPIEATEPVNGSLQAHPAFRDLTIAAPLKLDLLEELSEDGKIPSAISRSRPH